MTPEEPVGRRERRPLGDLVRRARGIDRANAEFKVSRWLAGSTIAADCPTLAELELCGYRVARAQAVCANCGRPIHEEGSPEPFSPTWVHEDGGVVCRITGGGDQTLVVEVAEP